MMVGNPKLAQLGYGEEALGRNAIAAGFQGQRAWTDHFPNGDFMEAILTSSFDWNGIREPFMLATVNDTLNGITMLFGHLLTDAAQIFADALRLLESGCSEARNGPSIDGNGRKRNHSSKLTPARRHWMEPADKRKTESLQ